MGLTQDKWAGRVRTVLGKWFKPDPSGRRAEDVADWDLVCGNLGGTLKNALVRRNPIPAGTAEFFRDVAEARCSGKESLHLSNAQWITSRWLT